MSRGHNPLFWMMACTLPSAGHALGLGEIHVDSALNEPLAAEIDIVGATPDELVGLIATVANRETFAHFAAERPAFLNTATFKVTKDARGKPILAIRSSDSFTEPVVDLVVDLRWRNGQLIRQYSLLLDPAGFPSAPQAATALPVPPSESALPAPVITAAAPASSPAEPFSPAVQGATTTDVADGSAASSTTAAVSARKMTQIKVGAKATLRGIAWRVGARSNADLNQMMIAIFRANPSAFDGNINRLHLGAVLKIPSAEEVAAIPNTEANRETHAQMKAWLESVKRPGSNPVSTVAAADSVPQAPAGSAHAPEVNTPPATPAADSAASPAAPAVAAAATVAAPSTAATAATAAAAATAAVPAAKSVDQGGDKAALTTKILSLEGSLQEIQAQLEAQHNKLLTMQAQVRYAEQHPKVVVTPALVDRSNRELLNMALAGLALLGGVCVALLMRLRGRAKTNALPSIEKVPGVAPVETVAASPAKPRPAPVIARAPEAPRMEVQEHHGSPSEPLIEARGMRPDAHEEPRESALELSAADTAGINATKLWEELAAAKLREEIAAAWALPAAETYKREDMNHESTLAQDIAKSLEDTLNLEAAKARSEEDTVDEEAYTETIANDTGTLVGVVGDTANFAATEVLPEATMKMSAEDFPAELDPDQLDYNLTALDDEPDTGSATDKIKVTGEVKLAADGLKLGADDPHLSLHDELKNWEKKSA